MECAVRGCSVRRNRSVPPSIAAVAPSAAPGLKLTRLVHPPPQTPPAHARMHCADSLDHVWLRARSRDETRERFAFMLHRERDRAIVGSRGVRRRRARGDAVVARRTTRSQSEH